MQGEIKRNWVFDKIQAVNDIIIKQDTITLNLWTCTLDSDKENNLTLRQKLTYLRS